MRCVFVCFLEEIEVTKKSFQNYLTFRGCWCLAKILYPSLKTLTNHIAFKLQWRMFFLLRYILRMLLLLLFLFLLFLLSLIKCVSWLKTWGVILWIKMFSWTFKLYNANLVKFANNKESLSTTEWVLGKFSIFIHRTCVIITRY